MIGDVLQTKYEKAASVICKQGIFPFSVNETTLTILKHAVDDVEAELDLIAAFDNKASQSLDELKVSSGMQEEAIVELADSLARKGLLFNQPNTAGMMVYRLLPLMTVGLMEYTFMGPLQWNEKEKELAVLFQRLIDEVRDRVQENYDSFVPLFNMSPPVDRTVLPAPLTKEKPSGSFRQTKTWMLPRNSFSPASQSMKSSKNSMRSQSGIVSAASDGPCLENLVSRTRLWKTASPLESLRAIPLLRVLHA